MPKESNNLTGQAKSTLIMAIETSCDETSISVLRHDKNKIQILSNIISSQVKLHAKWGGVVPNLAAREHVKNMPQVLQKALGEAQISPAQIDVIAVTSGPGLIPALMTGTGTAKTLAYLWEKPLLGIHHIEGHIYANFIGDKISENTKLQKTNHKQNLGSGIKFPILCLVVSGGHTQLVLMKDHLKYEIIGQTVDDAVGEAFDKVARIMGIGYPGGPSVAKWATQVESRKLKVESATKYEIRLPRPMLNKQGYNFSFSGLKTAVLYETKKFIAANLPKVQPSEKVEPSAKKVVFPKDYIAELCHEFQQACIDVLVTKTIKASEQYKPKTIMLAGGVSANTELRKQLGESIKKNLHYLSNQSSPSYMTPDFSLTGDNAAMIGATAVFRWQKMSDAQKEKCLTGWKTLQPDANLKLK